MPSGASDITPTPYATPLTFRTEVRPTLYLASAGLLVLGFMFTGFFLWGPPGHGIIGVVIAAVGVFMVYVAWVNFWVTRAGYPHLILRGHQLSVRSSDAFRRDLDLGKLGETRIVVITGPKASRSTYLGFLPLSGAAHKPSRFTAPRLQEFAETVLLNGYIGSNLRSAKDIERVIDQRRAEPRQDLPPLPDDTLPRAAARARLIGTAAVFAAVWVPLVWWKLLP
jgi:hypothetical protein